MVEESESQTESREERRKKRLQRLTDYDTSPEAAKTREQFAQQSDQTVEVRVEEKKPEQRPKVEVTKTNRKAPTKEELATTAPVILNLANTFVITSFGNDCGMTQQEATVIGPSLQRCLERLPYGAAKQASVFIDPLVLLIGLAMWGKRIMDVQDRRAKEKYQVKPTEQMRANGVSGFTYEAAQAPPTPVTINGSEPQPVSPPFSTANGVPDAIRKQEEDYGVPY